MESLEDYICARFATAKIQTDPCPHVIIENILPSELYDSIEKDIPTQWRWYDYSIRATFWKQVRAARQRWPKRKWTLVPGCIARTIQIAMRPVADSDTTLAQPALDWNNPDRCSPGLRQESAKWQHKYSKLSVINSCLESAFEPHTTNYMDQLVAAGIFSEPQKQTPFVNEFCYRLRGWTISPHTHDIGQSIQWMIYFPQPGSTEDQGTLFYRLTKPKKLEAQKLRGSIYFDQDEAEYCFTVPYRKNMFIAFLNTPRSIHSTVEITNMPARRYFFGCLWWKDAPSLADIEVTPRGITPSTNAALVA